jgi:hypothetical protein
MRRRSLVLGSAPALAALSLLAAGCGGSGGTPGVANVGTNAATTTQNQTGGLVAFSQCMRSHGLPSFPDPQHYADGNVKLTMHQVGNTPQFRQAINACNQLLPANGGGGSQQTAAQQRKQLEDELSFARCMRSHGITRFPDPTAQGQLTVAMAQAQGIDVHSTAVLRVVQACIPASHGGLTMQKVREAIDHADG